MDIEFIRKLLNLNDITDNEISAYIESLGFNETIEFYCLIKIADTKSEITSFSSESVKYTLNNKIDGLKMILTKAQAKGFIQPSNTTTDTQTQSVEI